MSKTTMKYSKRLERWEALGVALYTAQSELQEALRIASKHFGKSSPEARRINELIAVVKAQRNMLEDKADREGYFYPPYTSPIKGAHRHGCKALCESSEGAP
jgi:hypothetical protein